MAPGGTGQRAIDAAGRLGFAAASGLLTWVTATLGISLSPALATLLAVVGFVVAFAFALALGRYAAIITRRGPHERMAYDALRQSLVDGGLPARIYSERLRKMLDAVDRFFGDAGMAERTLWPHAFGLRTPAPLWTAPAFDRCLLLALLYPILTMSVIWAASGHVGPAEHALGLRAGLSVWQRSAGIALVWFPAFAIWYASRQKARSARRALWFLAALGTTLTVFVTGNVPGAVTMAVALGATCAICGAADAAAGDATSVFAAGFARSAGAGAIAGTCSFAVGIAAIATGDYELSSFGGAVCLIIFYLGDKSVRNRWQGPFQLSLVVFLSLTCFTAAYIGPQHAGWLTYTGPLSLIFGLLTLINAPFDWLSLGFTRALLRRGLEIGGWWPYVLAMVDALCAAGVITILTVVSVLSIQLFDALAASAAGDDARILPLAKLFEGIGASPAAPEFWWVYALLLSTMIPSLVNLMIGGASLVRGVPWVTRLLLWKMPERAAPPSFDRPWITLLLTLQVFIGGAIGILAQGILVYLVIWWLLPPFGLDLLDLARAVAAPDLPGRAITAAHRLI